MMMKKFNRLKWLHNINKKGVPGGAPFLLWLHATPRAILKEGYEAGDELGYCFR